MSQPEPNKNESSKMRKLLNGGSDDSPLSKLPRNPAGATRVKSIPPQPAVAAQPLPESSTPKLKTKVKAAPGMGYGNYKFLPAFWTIASIMSFSVNIVLLIVLAILLQNFSAVGVTVTGLSDQLLGGLYTNFVKMDQAHITTTIPVSQEIPVQFTLNVSGPTSVTLSEDVTINGALVTVNTGGLNINRASANIVLPQGTVLPIFIQNLSVPVDQKVLAELNVAVDIPLNETDLHEPFVGLQQVVEPYYCMVENQQVFVDGANVCP
jgi:hypothetical protein